tara:strand:- start:250 stop:684 length:435 start_codon:yes stop_codon:yes gene_type:complete
MASYYRKVTKGDDVQFKYVTTSSNKDAKWSKNIYTDVPDASDVLWRRNIHDVDNPVGGTLTDYIEHLQEYVGMDGDAHQTIDIETEYNEYDEASIATIYVMGFSRETEIQYANRVENIREQRATNLEHKSLLSAIPSAALKTYV